MSDQNAQPAIAPSFSMQRVFLKDLSLEMPNAPQIFLEQDQPKVEVNIAVGGQALAETVYESNVTATVTTRINDKVLYLVEVTQAGIFEISNVVPEQLDALMGIVCPTMLYPYLRANVADAITDWTTYLAYPSPPPEYKGQTWFRLGLARTSTGDTEGARAAFTEGAKLDNGPSKKALETP